MIVTTSTFKMNTVVFKNVLKLYQEYLPSKDLSGAEFIEAKLQTSDQKILSNDVIEKFISLVSHKNFLEAVKNNFVARLKLRNYNDVKIIMIIYLIIFGSEGGGVEDLFQVFREIKCAFKQKLLEYFYDENNLITTALTGCKFFEDDYVLKNIINPVLAKAEVLKQITEHLVNDRANKYAKKPPTVPDHLRVLQRKLPVPTVPLNTPTESRHFQATGIPRSLYMPDSTETRLMGEFEKNRLRSQQLLEEAKKLSKNYCKPKKPVTPEPPKTYKFKAKRPPSLHKPVQIKENAAAVLREGILRIKEHEKEIKNIETILQGGSTLEKFRELEEEERLFEQQKLEEDIEKKHLEGLLTFEEAILAKKKLLESNKERFREFMEERENILLKINQWKDQEQEKIKMLVRKGQNIKENAKISRRKCKEEKHNQVNQFKEEKKKLFDEAYKKQQEELIKKVKLIEEIKMLHQLRSIHQPKEFDPTECPHLGLLCEMSIAELQDKLSEMKVRMKEELERKRRCIRKYKERQKQMIENVRNFVAQARMSKPKQQSVPIRPPELAPRNPDLDKLRSQLEYARELRKNNQTG